MCTPGATVRSARMTLMADQHHRGRREGRRMTAELLGPFDLVDASGPAATHSGCMRRLDVAMPLLVGAPRARRPRPGGGSFPGRFVLRPAHRRGIGMLLIRMSRRSAPGLSWPPRSAPLGARKGAGPCLIQDGLWQAATGWPSRWAAVAWARCGAQRTSFSDVTSRSSSCMSPTTSTTKRSGSCTSVLAVRRTVRQGSPIPM